MIVIFKDTLGDGSIANMDIREHVRTSQNSTINKEFDSIRYVFGHEKELIYSEQGKSICLVYERYKWYVIKT